MASKSKTAEVQEVEPVSVSVADAAKLLGISTWNAYQLCDQGHLDARYAGRRRLVSYASVKAYFAALPKEPEEKTA